MLCPSCRALIARDASNCPYCKIPLPSLLGGSGIFGRLFSGELSFSRGFFAANAMIFGLLAILSLRAGSFSTEGVMTFGAPGHDFLWKAGVLETHAVRDHSQWWRFFTAIFLHYSILHIVFNLMWLRFAGPLVEHFFGPARFIVIYIGAAAIAFVAWYFLSSGQGSTAGASGAIFGLMGALAVYGFRRGGIFGEALGKQMIAWGLLGIASGFAMPGTNNVAHIVGAVSGALLASVLKIRDTSSSGEGPFVRVLATLILLVLASSWVLAGIHGARYERRKDFELEHHLGVFLREVLSGAVHNAQVLSDRGGLIEEGESGREDRQKLVQTFDETVEMLRVLSRRGEASGLSIAPQDLASKLDDLSSLLSRKAS
jgi:rhomboid protease GluP